MKSSARRCDTGSPRKLSSSEVGFLLELLGHPREELSYGSAASHKKVAWLHVALPQQSASVAHTPVGGSLQPQVHVVVSHAPLQHRWIPVSSQGAPTGKQPAPAQVPVWVSAKSPAWFEWPLMQPSSDVLICTYGFLLDPVAWQMSDFPFSSNKMTHSTAVSAEPLFDRSTSSCDFEHEQSVARSNQALSDQALSDRFIVPPNLILAG